MAPTYVPVREPDCVHSYNWLFSGYMQPASACSICRDRPELKEWKSYWESPEGQERMARLKRYA